MLRDLGFDLGAGTGTSDRRGGRADAELNHLVLVADGLPTDDNPGGRWWVDVGLGDAFRDPLP